MSEVFPPPPQEAMEASLSSVEYNVCFLGATERRGTGKYAKTVEPGTYLCRICGLPLFSSEAKYDSGTGWPSFFQPVDPLHLAEIPDRVHGPEYEECVCANCGSHLGHILPDGPPPTGLRFCMNSASLRFQA